MADFILEVKQANWKSNKISFTKLV